MALGIFARAEALGLAKLGEPSSLDGLPCGNVHLEHGVELYAGVLDNADDNHVVRHVVAKILSTYNPKVGAVLVHPDGRFLLDRRVETSGYAQRFVVVAAPL